MASITRIVSFFTVCLLLLNLSACGLYRGTKRVFNGAVDMAHRATPHGRDYVFQQWVDSLYERGIHVVQVGETITFILNSDDFFYTNTAEIKPGRSSILTEIAHHLQRCGCSAVVVSAHTDDIGDFQSKLERAQHQAETVAGHLWHNGVVRRRIMMRGVADDKQIATDDTIMGSFHNRRVEIQMH